MSAKIIQFPRSNERVSQLVDEILETRLSHSDPDVLRCLRGELKTLIEKYFPGEEFSATLALPNDLSEAQFKAIEENFRSVFQDHSDRMIRRVNSLFFDLCLSRMTICELRHQKPETSQDN